METDETLFVFDLARRKFRGKNGRFMIEEISKSDIRAMLIKSLMLKISPEEIGDETPLFGLDGLGLDSIDALELVVSMEKNYGVGVANSGIAQTALKDVNSLYEYINAERAKKAS